MRLLRGPGEPGVEAWNGEDRLASGASHVNHQASGNRDDEECFASLHEKLEVFGMVSSGWSKKVPQGANRCIKSWLCLADMDIAGEPPPGPSSDNTFRQHEALGVGLSSVLPRAFSIRFMDRLRHAFLTLASGHPRTVLCRGRTLQLELVAYLRWYRYYHRHSVQPPSSAPARSQDIISTDALSSGVCW